MLVISLTAASLNSGTIGLNFECDEAHIEDCYLFSGAAELDTLQPVNIEDISVYELEEAVHIGFDTKQYLPIGFNPLKGKGDLDWNSIELYELEEAVSINFDTKQYLPAGFNALKGKGDLDWKTLELYEMEEEVSLGFDTKAFLPADFYAQQSL